MHRRRKAPAFPARLPAALGLLGLLTALCVAVATASAASHSVLPPVEKPSFVVIQTDDQTLDGLYAAYRTFEGTGKTRAMPNTLDLIGKRGMTFNRYYVSYPLCCPSRVSLLTGRYAHNHNVKGNIQPNGGFTGFEQQGAYTHNLAVWMQNAGYKTIHIGKFLNGYGDKPYDDGKTVPPGWSSWHTILNADTNHYFYGYLMNNNGTIEGPYGDSGSWETREYGARDDAGCPFAPTNGLPCYYETDHLTELATHEILETPSSPSTCSSTTPPRTATSAARPGRSRLRATTTGSRAPASPTTAPKGLTRATSGTSRASSAMPPTSPSTTSTPTGSTGRSSSRACARSTTG
jgi:hypothetical protein